MRLPQIKTIILMRHGQTAKTQPGTYYGWTELYLDEEGRAQAERAGQRLARVKLDAVYTSPLLRCVQTARLMKLAPPIQTVDGLKELSFGRWEGVRVEEAQKEQAAWAQWTGQGLDGAPPEGESARAFHQRVSAAFDGLLAQHEGSCTLLMVAHHGTLRAILAHVLGLDAGAAWHFRCAPGSLSQLEIVDGYPVLTRWNA